MYIILLQSVRGLRTAVKESLVRSLKVSGRGDYTHLLNNEK